MIGLTERATRQLQGLRSHYEKLDRYEALRNLNRALYQASAAIEQDPAHGRAYPATYRHLARPQRLWLKVGRYWIGYRPSPPPVITAVFYDQANIPGRL